MKKKIVSILIATIMVVSALCVFAACNPQSGDAILKEAIEEGQKMTEDQLIEKAKAETGDFVAYGNTSRISDAMKGFIAKYGTKLGLSGGSGVKKTDSEIYTLLTSEQKSANKSKNASMVLIQDSATLMQYRNGSTILANYVPKGMEDLVDENNRVPLAHQFINKLFMYNTAGDTTAKFTNVWQLTEEGYKGKIFFKSPTSEQVNMNFLIMLTSDNWSNKLKDAYKSLYGKEATDIGNGKDQYKNYGYKWIAEFLANCNFSINSDTTIAQKLSTEDNAGNMGLFVLSKLRDSSVYGNNLQVSAWDKDAQNNLVKIEPFAGFMYSIYAQLATYGPRPYTAMLFINYLMTEEGFKPWKSLGGYSANTSIKPYEGSVTTPVEKEGHIVYLDNNKKEMYISDTEKVDGKTVTTYTYYEGGTIKSTDKIEVNGEQVELKAKVKTQEVSTIKDSDLSFWTQNLVVEDGAYILSVKATVLDWINARLPKD